MAMSTINEFQASRDVRTMARISKTLINPLKEGREKEKRRTSAS